MKLWKIILCCLPIALVIVIITGVVGKNISNNSKKKKKDQTTDVTTKVTTERKTTERKTTEKKYNISVVNNTSFTIAGDGKYTSGSSVTLSATNYVAGYFLMWKINGEVKEIGSTYTLEVGTRDINITLEAIPYDYLYLRTEKNIYFGTYPQTQVTNRDTINDLNKNNEFDVTTWTDYGYLKNETSYMYYKDVDLNNDGFSDFRGVYFTEFRNGEVSKWDYETNTIYWFSFDPIKWNILAEEDDKALLYANLHIDSQEFYGENRSDVFEHNGGEGYANNYELSNIRKWLNETFYETAFNQLQKELIIKTLVDNSIEQAYKGSIEDFPTRNYSNYDIVENSICADTNDNIFLLSFREIFDYYDPEHTGGIGGSKLRTTSTDYARIQGVQNTLTQSGTYGNSVSWLRTPGTQYNCADYIAEAGGVEAISIYNAPRRRNVNDTCASVRPALWINLKVDYKKVTVTNSDTLKGRLNLTGEYDAPVGYTLKLFATSRLGYEFDGWYINDILVSSDIDFKLDIVEDVTIEAKWKNTKYDVKVINKTEQYDFDYDKEGTYEFNSSVTLTFKPNAGYYVELYDENNNKLELNNNTYTFTMPSNTLEYSVYFKKYEYTITYVDEFGLDNPNETIYNVESNDITLINLEKYGYVFNGWYNDESKVTVIEKGSTGDLTLTANWSKAKFNVTASNTIDGVTVNGLGEYEYLDEVELTVTRPAGQEVKIKIDNEEVGLNSYTFTITQNVEIEIEMEIGVYSITYIVLANLNNPNDKTTYTINDAFDLIALTPDADKYSFDGWYIGSEEVTRIENRFGDLVIEAKLTPVKYTVNIVNNTDGFIVTGEGEYNYDDIVTIKPTNTDEALYIEVDSKLFTTDCYEFFMPNKNVTVTVERIANQHYYYDYADDKVVYFGTYPQTLVTDSALLYTLNNKIEGLPTETELNGWTDYNYMANSEVKHYMWYLDIDLNNDNVNDYRAVYFTEYRPVYTDDSFNNYEANGYEKGNIYFFKYEKIAWRKSNYYNDGDTILICDFSIDKQDFSKAAHGSDYTSSYLKEFLTTTFYDTAFNDLEKSLLKNHEDDSYIRTNDKVSIMVNSSAVNHFLNGTAYKKVHETDYAKCQSSKAIVENISDLEGNYYLSNTRHPYVYEEATWIHRSTRVYSPQISDYYDSEINTKQTCISGIRPVINLDVEKYYKVILESNNDEFGTVSGGGLYTNESEITISATTNTGYLLSGWYDGDTKISPDATYTYTVSKDVTLVAKFGVPYTITYTNVTGLENTNPTEFTEYDEITLADVEKEYYDFNGWYLNDNKVTKIEKGTTNNVTLEARFSLTEYTITYEGVEGATHSNPTKYTYEDAQIDLENATKDGYKFIKWLKDDEEIESIPTHSSGNITITAVFEILSFDVTLVNNTDGIGFTGDGTYEFNSKVVIKPTNLNSDKVFSYEVDGKVFVFKNYEFNMPSKNVEITIMDIENRGYELGDEIVYFGSYPKTHVTDMALINTLTGKVGTLPTADDSGSWTDYNYIAENNVEHFMWYQDISYGGEKYRAVYYTHYRPEDLEDYFRDTRVINSFTSIYPINTIHFFKFEKIAWLYANDYDGSKVLVSLYSIDNQSFNDDTNWNNYDDSDFRDFLCSSSLSGNFYNTAFSNEEKNMLEIVYGESDKVTIFSDENNLKLYLEGTNYLKTTPTDYSVIQRPIYDYDREGFDGGGVYFIMKSIDNYNSIPGIICDTGTTTLSREKTRNRVCGVRPIIKLSTSKAFNVKADIINHVDGDVTNVGGTVLGAGGYYYGDNVTLTAVADTNYIFYAWYDLDGNFVSNSNVLENITDNAHYKALFLEKYYVTYDGIVEGDTNPNPSFYTEQQGIVLEDASRVGYTFNGWTDKNGAPINVISMALKKDITITANFTINSYSVDGLLPDGVEVDGLGSYEYGSEVTVSVSSIAIGYKLKIYDDEEVYYNTYTFTLGAGNKMLVFEKEAIMHTITLNKSTDLNIEGLDASGKHRYNSTVTLSVIDAAAGSRAIWTVGDFTYVGNIYQFIMPDEDITITVEMAEIYTRNGDKIYFGYYPQTALDFHNEADVALMDELNDEIGAFDSTNPNWISYGYIDSSDRHAGMYYYDYDRNGNHKLDDGDYRAVYITNSSSTQSSNGYFDEIVYWFKYEKVEWEVLTEKDGKALIVSKLLVDSQNYQYVGGGSGQSDPFDHNGGVGFENNYALSDIRLWLNDKFYNTVFSSLEKTIINETEVDNSLASTGDETNTYVCEDTNDNIFLLSYSEANNSNYFDDNAARVTTGTDYAKCQGLNCDTIKWLLRSPKNDAANDVKCVFSDGSFDAESVRSCYMGIRPAMWITL